MKHAGPLLAVLAALALAGGAAYVVMSGDDDPGGAPGDVSGGGGTDGREPDRTPRDPARTDPRASRGGGDAPVRRKPPDPGRNPDLPDPPQPRAGLRLPDNRWSRFQDGADWRRVGVGLRRQILAAQSVAQAVRNGREPEAEWKAFGAAMEIVRNETFPGMAEEARWGSHAPMADAVLHPGIYPNAICAALEAFHRPVTDAQAEALAAAVKDYSEVWDDRPQGEWNLARTARVAAAAEVFRAAAAAVLDPDQQALLWPEETGGRYRLDPLSPADMLGERPCHYDGTEKDLFRMLGERALGAFDRPDVSLPSTLAARARSGVEAAGYAAPKASPDLLTRQGFPRYADLRIWAEIALAAGRGIAEHPDTPEKARERLAELYVSVPVPTAGRR
ncbi:MAG: hypothetical protein HMLKMBBP_03396 [Planctomycetes bacterium]|nr:hypothetical protein [Planctomycetota bacterium]